MTRQRRAVVNAIARWRGSFTAVELYDRARKTDPTLGIATVYRTIDLLRRSGSVRPLPGAGKATYVRCHPGHHHHLICLSCGSVQETELCAAPTDAELRRAHGFAPEAHDVDVYGTCAECRAA